jgi:tRNA pseudouridine38-40 synthase
LNHALLLAYDGAAFRGWQKQPGLLTVQGALEDAIQTLLGRRLVVHGASRTDAGVHALGQVASLRTTAVDLGRLVLPGGLRLIRWTVVPDSFHARATAVGKRYRYELGRLVPKGDWARARAALRGLEGLPALTGLSSPSKDHRPAPPLAAWTLSDQGSLFIEAAAFRKHEVRNLAGHLGAVSLGYATPESLRLLAQRSAPWRGARAPADRLTLLEVLYPPEHNPFGRAASPTPQGNEAGSLVEPA